jgi:HEAT repeat protein
MGLFGPPNIEKLKLAGKTKAVIKALGHKDESIRIKAAKALGEMGDDDAIPGLIAALEQGEPSLQKEAIGALRALGASEAKQTFVNLLAWKHTDFYVEKEIVEVLAEIADPSIVTMLVEKMRSSEKQQRASLAFDLGEIGERSAIAPLLELFENDPCLDVRIAAVRALGQLGDEQVSGTLSQALIRLASHEDSYSSELSSLEWFDCNGGDYDMYDPLAEALGMIGDPGAGDALIRAHERDTGLPRPAILRALGRVKEQRAIPLLETAIDFDDLDPRVVAVEALATIGGEAWDVLERKASSGSVDAKKAVAFGLQCVAEELDGDARAKGLALVNKLAADREGAVSAQAQAALRKF